MNPHWVLPTPEYYARLNTYILEYGLPYRMEDIRNWKARLPNLFEILGAGEGRTVLDCSCGWGTQTIPLAKLGWQVTACDVSETSMTFAREFAELEEVKVDFRLCDMRDLAGLFKRQFDCVVCCKSLYEITTDDGIRQAIHGMFTVLKPGGQCYLELRDMDELMKTPRERHIFRGERRVPNGRIICIQDWEYESESTVIAMEAFLREDERLDPSDHFRWVTETIGERKKVLRKADLQDFLQIEGFEPVTFLPKPKPWMDVQVIAFRPAG